MPFSLTTVSAGGGNYASPFVGPVDHFESVRIDVSGLDTNTVDTDGYLKPGVPFLKNGTLVARRPGLFQVKIAGGAAGAHTVTGIKSTDTLVSVLHYTPGSSSTFADLTSEFTVSDDDEIDNTSGTSTASDELIVTYQTKDAYVFGVVAEPVKVAAGNTTTLLNAATDIDVALARAGMVNRDVVEDNLGRALTTNELLAFEDAGCRLFVTAT